MRAAGGNGAAMVLGHPRGVYYLAFTEAWERFSYYGMTGLLALYMVDALLLPGHVEHVIGMAALRHALESFAGPLSPQALASQIFGLYTGFVYFTPLFGGLIADRWIGQRSAVVLGALCMSAGNTCMAFDRSFLVALLLLIVGSGLLKGNIASQVGGLYPPADEARRTRGFVMFSTGINVGAVLGPLVCGYLAQGYGWHFGFGAAAVFMLVGLATYLHGYRYLPARVQQQAAGAAAPLSAADRRRVLALFGVLGISLFQSIAYLQIFNVAPVWTEQHVALTLHGFTIPVPWYQSIHALSSIVGVVPLFWLWGWQASRGREPHDLGKLGIGAWLAAASNLILVWACLGAPQALINPAWPLLYVIVLGIAFMYYWPTLLALVSRNAPPRANSTLMGITYMSLALANTLIGWIGSFYERMSARDFWALHAAIAAIGGVLVLLFGTRLTATLQGVPAAR
jgi:POT family proton-dependent oligopeptide transporter